MPRTAEHTNHSTLQDTGIGLGSGFLATVPMTAAMIAMQRLILNRPPHRLPPVEITDRLTERLEPLPNLDGKPLRNLSLFNHFAYGAAVGGLYAPLARRLPGPAVSHGIGYGFLVWAISYMGLMPALGLYPHAKNQPRRMNLLMILAHIVWGGALGLLTARSGRVRT